MNNPTREHGESGHCPKCGAGGRFEQGNDVDGPEHLDWIGRKSCHECHDREGHEFKNRKVT